jgi:creatinine amidohydrolase
MNDWNLFETSYETVRNTPYEVAVLPVGACEPHNLHLPYGTDAISVQAVAAAACKQASIQGAQVCLLPTIPYGINENTLAFPMTMSIRPSTLFAFIGDLVRCLEAHGVKKMVLVNGHGGNEFKPLLRELCTKHAVHVFLIDWWQAAKEAGASIFERKGEHGDEMETSLLMHLRPELVDLPSADDGAIYPSRLDAVNDGTAWLARPWNLLTKNSGYGDPSLATPEKGERFMGACVEKIAAFLLQLSSEPVDEAFPY